MATIETESATTSAIHSLDNGSDITLHDVERTKSHEKDAVETSSHVDIEHAVVEDDPRKWSRTRRLIIVTMVCVAAMIAGLGGNVYNPAIAEIESDLHATASQMSLTLSLFILVQGGFPLIWSSISEIHGRKIVYLLSITLCMLGCIVSATAQSINVLIGMRCLQAAGSSAVVSIGAATLADLYEPVERGTMMGVYLCAPLLGPSIGPIIGGILTQAFGWRATFWFLAIFTGLCAVSFVFFRDTFRRERSLTYQAMLKRVKVQQATRDSSKPQQTVAEGLPAISEHHSEKAEGKTTDAEKAIPVVRPHAESDIKLTLKDMNLIRPIFQVVRRVNNAVILLASALLFAFEYCILYTASLTLAHKYDYDALTIGLVLLSFGFGCLLGSILGGRYSDHVLAHFKVKNGGKSSPEMRLQSTIFGMALFPPVVVAYGWLCQEHIHVAAVCVTLFFNGFLVICIYSSTLAYIVDANTGRSSSAVATNSAVRGLFGFIATELAVPLENAIGDGGLYTLWGGLMIISELLILLVWKKGGVWRERVTE